MAVAVIFFFVGMGVCLATNPTFPLVFLSDRYAAATTELQRSQLLAAGEAVLAIGQGTNLGGFFMEMGALIISVVMLRDTVFSKVTAYAGILGHSLDLIHFIVFPSMPAIGALLLTIGGSIQVIWYILLARRLY